MCFCTKFDWAPAAPAPPPPYLPRAAWPLISALLSSSSWPAATSFPAQALRQEACRARPKEKVKLGLEYFRASSQTGPVVHLGVEDCSEDLLRQQSHAIKNQ